MVKPVLKKRITAGVLIISLFPLFAADSYSQGKKGKEMVFEESVIEGKIKRPQVVLISADQRPKFRPMAINNFTDTTQIMEQVAGSVFEQNRFEDPMKLDFSSK